jgi:hypothetical protein
MEIPDYISKSQARTRSRKGEGPPACSFIGYTWPMARNLAHRILLPLLLMTACLAAQQSEDLLARLRKLQLVEKPGQIPVLYAPSAEQRAMAYENSLRAAHACMRSSS